MHVTSLMGYIMHVNYTVIETTKATHISSAKYKSLKFIEYTACSINLLFSSDDKNTFLLVTIPT